jgi:hypothetical protein
MELLKRNILITTLTIVLVYFLGASVLSAESVPEKLSQRIADVTYASSAVYIQPRVNYSSLEITVSCPDGTVVSKRFEGGSTPFFNLSELNNEFIDGSYTFELRANLVSEKKIRLRGDESSLKDQRSQIGERGISLEPLVQTGYFMVSMGSIVVPDLSLAEREPVLKQQQLKIQDQVILDDLIVDGSACIGQDCVNGESFGFDTLRLKENNLRIKFQDTSSSASFPSNDWQITANESSNGGANKFSIDDIDGGRTPFTIEASAPSHSLYVDDGGRLGFGTSTPVVDLHSKSGNTTTLRLEQDGTSGFTPQTWDVAGNEANFFVRDATNGSKLPFKIQPSAPTNSIFIKSDGKLGFGTQSPSYKVHALTSSSENCAIVAERTGGAKNFINATEDYGNFGTATDHSVQILTNTSWSMRINTDDTLDMKDGGGYNGTWNPASSRELKENIQNLDTGEAKEALAGLYPVKFNYKKNTEEPRVGFISEDVPELVALNGRKSLATVDIIAVLTKVVQDQQKAIKELREEIGKLKEKK